MTYRIDYLDSTNEQVITVPIGTKAHFAFTAPDINPYNSSRVYIAIWDGKYYLYSSTILTVSSPYLPEYISVSANPGTDVQFGISSNKEEDIKFKASVHNYSSGEPTSTYDIYVRIQFRNINQNGVYDGYQYR